MINIVLVEPRIAANVGTIGRTCYNLDFTLHLIGPHFLDYDDKKIMRAGLDYWFKLKPVFWDNAQEFLDKNDLNKMKFASTKSNNSYFNAKFNKGDFIIFGNETYGLSKSKFNDVLTYENTFLIPMGKNARSLNLAMSVGFFSSEALRQIM
ncbi:tRNA (cytidine(34)-2'-O)-methyltransferase [Campylobacter canadensis]|uniref:Putative tRNA (cytidine(34)-2'-O)-methyltransferase n=1 Tax=Campylobacter canadensis TaxID=449520 RepID=A0ABS7WPH1_9BACT|nr:TrmH family RNA methyltransferase [Campylobacter canadensis]MBZ7986663.1 tRNA (cytidine(34)-2'-O)-methyltransferase [Campylobacter canadensis]MBZ7993932.1 tRNA (cytidine(34)-2'-O)-methyltransferase [Campylobacter canadensis]MBZ7996248.1 tRNA (cytidine(34)-2'-O)-methyltransferase [Campylobacter canadensis]MBZ7997699.1 tRNA (cytidine(34)-2'-O)-methyltransferase [Campylobacter canadensis]MBZ7999265.1 tRNA (cytidine(34)-2'-O)-methyltransferase [Campylobacter canadensis]